MKAFALALTLATLFALAFAGGADRPIARPGGPRGDFPLSAMDGTGTPPTPENPSYQAMDGTGTPPTPEM